MRVLVQRVINASVKYDLKENSIDKGLLLYVGFTNDDDIEVITKMAKKVVNLRIFDDDNNIMNKSLLDVEGSILSISQFTLYALTKKGNRPSYINALNRSLAKPLYKIFNEKLKEYGLVVKEGFFGEDMKITSINDGPITIMLEIEKNKD